MNVEQQIARCIKLHEVEDAQMLLTHVGMMASYHDSRLASAEDLLNMDIKEFVDLGEQFQAMQEAQDANQLDPE